MSIYRPCLVLSAAFEPLAITTARRAITLLVKESVVVIEDYGREVYPGIMLPSVVRLKIFHYIPPRVTQLTKKNIYIRDRYTCQYCGFRSRDARKLSLDHIVPKSLGGVDKFENLVTCCLPCNHKKGNKPLEETGMKLLHKPRPLTVHTSRSLLRTIGLSEDPRWQRYLYA